MILEKDSAWQVHAKCMQRESFNLAAYIERRTSLKRKYLRSSPRLRRPKHRQRCCGELSCALARPPKSHHQG